jgi:hypothetical protein
MAKTLIIRTFIVGLLILFSAVHGFGEKIEFNAEGKLEYNYFYNELDRILEERGAEQLGSLTLAEVNEIAGDLSISIQKTAFVEKSRKASMLFPGAGQFMNQDALAGSLFVAGNIATMAGTLLLSYALLPDDLKLDKTNPFTDSIASVNESYESYSFVDYLPSIGALVGGIAVNIILRIISANNAEHLAKQNIEADNVEFQPYSFLGFRQWGHSMGMGR